MRAGARSPGSQALDPGSAMRRNGHASSPQADASHPSRLRSPTGGFQHGRNILSEQPALHGTHWAGLLVRVGEIRRRPTTTCSATDAQYLSHITGTASVRALAARADAGLARSLRAAAQVAWRRAENLKVRVMARLVRASSALVTLGRRYLDAVR